MDWEPVKYPYSTSLKWTGEHKGLLSCEGKPDINVACPPEWGGHAGIWSPEDLFVSSVEVCTLTTFLFLMEKMRGSILAYKSTAVGNAQMNEDSVFVFKEILVRPIVEVLTEGDAEKARRAFGECPDVCLITKTVKSDVRLDFTVTVKTDGKGR
jgi:organic hydroperoxide reductase OsmC/OhrA